MLIGCINEHRKPVAKGPSTQSAGSQEHLAGLRWLPNPLSGHSLLLLISCRTYCCQRVLWSLYTRPKQAKIDACALSIGLFTTGIHSSNHWPERKLMVPMLGLMHQKSAHLVHAHQLSAWTFSSTEQVSNARVHNNDNK